MTDNELEFYIDDYKDKQTPFVVRYKDGTAQVAFERDENEIPIRVPGFTLDADIAESLPDCPIIELGLNHLERFFTEAEKLSHKKIPRPQCLLYRNKNGEYN